MTNVVQVFEKYKIRYSDPIGKGVFGEVYHCEPLARSPTIPLKLAAKKIGILKEDIPDLMEIKILAKMSHPNIIKFHDVILTEKELFVVLEYADKGDLSQYVNETPNQRISAKETLNFLKQIASGLEYAYSEHMVIHRDIKPANILLTTGGKVKIADFGFARLVEDTHKKKMTKAIGSIFYMAPEIFNGKPYDYKCDIWSLGIMAYELVYGVAPWVTGLSDPDHFKYIMDNPEVKFPKKQGIEISEDFKDLIRKMLIYEPDKRIGWTEILKHKALMGQIEIEAKSYLHDNLIKMMIVISGKYEKFHVSFRNIYQILYFLHRLVTSLFGPNPKTKEIFKVISEFIAKNETNLSLSMDPKIKMRNEQDFEINSEFVVKFKNACTEFILEVIEENNLNKMDDEAKKVVVWLVFLRDLKRIDGKSEKEISQGIEELLEKDLGKLMKSEKLMKLK